MSSDAVIEVRNVSKRFGGVEALKPIDLDVRRGEVLAIVGDNGAGTGWSTNPSVWWRPLSPGTFRF